LIGIRNVPTENHVDLSNVLTRSSILHEPNASRTTQFGLRMAEKQPKKSNLDC